MKKMLKTKQGITLTSLVITIIIILILAGISIGALSGNNNIMDQAENSRTKTDIAGEKETLEEAIAIAMGKSRRGNVEKDKLEYALEDIAKDKTNVTEIVSRVYVEFVESKRFYKIDADGKYIELGQNYIIPTPITAEELYNQEDTSYIGAYVTNYDCPNNDGIDADIDKKWQILYSDEENIYIIASKTILLDYAPPGKNGSNLTPGIANMNEVNAVNYTNILRDYNGSSDITDERIKKLNNEYFNEKHYESSSNQLKATAYMLDISENVWGVFAGKYSDFAIGGPTLDLICASYNKKNGVNNLKTSVESNTGYRVSSDSGSTWNYSVGRLNSSPIFKSGCYLLATPKPVDTAAYWYSDTRSLHSITYGEFISYNDIYGTECGLRPVVCLKSSIYLEKNADGNYSIIE